MTSWISDSSRGQASSRPGRPPKSKSHAHRILILALAAETNSRISNRNAEFCIRSMTQLSRGDEKLLHSFVWCNPVSGSQIKELGENQARRGQEPSSPPKVPFPPSASPSLSPAAPHCWRWGGVPLIVVPSPLLPHQCLRLMTPTLPGQPVRQ